MANLESLLGPHSLSEVLLLSEEILTAKAQITVSKEILVRHSYICHYVDIHLKVSYQCSLHHSSHNLH